MRTSSLPSGLRAIITKRMRRALLLLFVSLFSVSLFAQENQQYRRGVAARQQGNLEAAVRHFQAAVRENPRDERHWLALGETLGWMERYEEAETVYRTLLERFPQSSEGRVGLARILLWTLQLDEAEALFREAARRNPGDLRALEGIALARYWMGDWRAARVYARRALAIDPQRDEMLRVEREIASASAPAWEIASSYISDDQPYRILLGSAGVVLFSDPLTKWQLSGGSYLLESGSRNESAPFVDASVESRFPAIDLGVEGRVRFLQFPDGESDVLPSLRASWHRQEGILSLFWERSELLRTRSAIDDHPSVDAIGIRWLREKNRGWSAAVSARHLSYYDGNRGVGADGWFLAAPLEIGRVTIRYGPALSYRDTEESRFIPIPGGDGVYDPYWTPEKLLEARAVVSLAGAVGPATVSVHADGGWGREEVSPELLRREFNPWRVRVGVEVPVGGRARMHLGLEQERTAFWEATSFHAAVAGRF
jgi:hypothetical protein